MGLEGPSREIKVEPVEVPAQPAPAREPAPEREPVPVAPEREKETVGA
jgi:hypothetical protein